MSILRTPLSSVSQSLRLASSSSRRNASTLILLEHRDNKLVPASLNAITAARKVGGPVHGLIVGEAGQVDGVVEGSKK